MTSRCQAETLLKQLIYQRPVPFPVQFQEPVPVFFLLNRSLTYGQNGPNGATAKRHIAVYMVKEREKELVHKMHVKILLKKERKGFILTKNKIC